MPALHLRWLIPSSADWCIIYLMRVVLGLLVAGCGASVTGEPANALQQDGRRADARRVDSAIADAQAADGPRVDAPPNPPDARPPCVEGTTRVTGPDGTCYWFVAQEVYQPQARAACQADGGDLAIIKDAAENELIGSLIDFDEAWIGATDAATEGTWLWIDGTPLAFTDWDPGQPNNFDGVEDCAVLSSDDDVSWGDRSCVAIPEKPDQIAYKYVCER